MGFFGGSKDGFDDTDYDAWRVHGAVNNVIGSDRLDNVFRDLAPDFNANLQKCADGDEKFSNVLKNRDYGCYYDMLNDKYKELKEKYNIMKKQYDALKASMQETEKASITH